MPFMKSQGYKWEGEVPKGANLYLIQARTVNTEMGPHSHVERISSSEGSIAWQTYQFREDGLDSASLDLRYLIMTKIM